MSQEKVVQEWLVEAVTRISWGGGPQSPSSVLLAPHLDARFSHRLEAYQQSFIGRAVASLSATVLRDAERLFSAGLVNEAVARYFAAQPPRHDCMVASLAALPAFLLGGPVDWHKQLLASVVRLALDQWPLLYGPDPAEGRFLAVWTAPDGLVDLGAAWQFCQGLSDGAVVAAAELEPFRTDPPWGALSVKTSPLEMSVIRVPQPLYPLAAQVALIGEAVAALDELSDDELAPMADADVHAFFLALGQLTVLPS